MNRREFLRMGGGILVACRLDPLWAWQAGEVPHLEYATDFNAYLRVAADGRITCYVGKIEMGQGNMTALAQLVAEELNVSTDVIDMVMGDTDLCPWDLGTFGSMSIAVFGPVLRAAAAEAREVLRQLAAAELHVAESTLVAEDGRFTDSTRPGRSVSYGELARGRAIEKHLFTPAPLKPAAAFTVIGQCVPRRDALAKVTGRATYAGDVRLPHMLYAAILRPPSHGASLSAVDTTRAAQYPGASVLREGDLLAVLHATPDGAAAARDMIFSHCSPSPALLDDESIYDHLVTAAPEGQTLAALGDVEASAPGCRRLAATYLNAYVAHAPIETHTALADFAHGKATVWASTQAPFMVRQEVASALGIPPDQVHVITPFVGGGFGGKTMARQAVEASRLSRAVGRPIQVCWDRREEFFFDAFRPAAVMKIASSVDDNGRIVSWKADVYGAGPGSAVPFYDIPNQLVTAYGGWQAPAPGHHPFAVGAWRAPAFCSNTFARERHVDTIAAAACIDPLEFRLRNLNDRRMARVLREAAARFGWSAAPAPSGRGYGIACSTYANTYVAMCVEVAVDRPTGAVRVLRVACAQDMGLVVNPEGAQAQVEGCIVMGLGSALSEEVHFSGGAIGERNFDAYDIPRFSWLPQIDVVLVDAPELPPSAGGEPAITCVAAAIGNAIHDASGADLTRLPMTPARVRAAVVGGVRPSSMA